MFLQLGDLNDTIKKSIIGLFYQCANNLNDPFDDIVKAATNYAERTETIPFSQLMNGIQPTDHAIILSLMKFVNMMIVISTEQKQGQFVALLEGVGIYDMIKEWQLIGNDEIQQ